MFPTSIKVSDPLFRAGMPVLLEQQFAGGLVMPQDLLQTRYSPAGSAICVTAPWVIQVQPRHIPSVFATKQTNSRNAILPLQASQDERRQNFVLVCGTLHEWD